MSTEGTPRDIIYILWIICCGLHVIWCGAMVWRHPCSPHHIYFLFSTAYHPHHIIFVLSTSYTSCRPHYIHRSSTVYKSYGVENPWIQYFMLWVTFLYGVVVSILCIWCGLHICCGKYDVDNMCIYCGQHVICCGYMPWTTHSSCIYRGEPYGVDDRSPHHI